MPVDAVSAGTLRVGGVSWKESHIQGNSKGSIELLLSEIVVQDFFDCCQKNVGMEESGMRIRHENVWKSYIEGYVGKSILILDNMTDNKRNFY